ncbi:MAG: hypothetical protein UY95_C0028G0006 [Parcubacteria group bacterium GW2011_GWA2_56_7]|nr:MAG: hypothetical protein UY95_C0028G0006 [Parcubacteria group bacterium GW2011_GWA2_56_7]
MRQWLNWVLIVWLTWRWRESRVLSMPENMLLMVSVGRLTVLCGLRSSELRMLPPALQSCAAGTPLGYRSGTDPPLNVNRLLNVGDLPKDFKEIEKCLVEIF